MVKPNNQCQRQKSTNRPKSPPFSGLFTPFFGKFTAFCPSDDKNCEFEGFLKSS